VPGAERDRLPCCRKSGWATAGLAARLQAEQTPGLYRRPAATSGPPTLCRGPPGRMRNIMLRIVCVHGVGQQRKGPRTLHAEWFPALADGCSHARLDPAEVECVFYGGLFRPPGRALGPGDPIIRPEDLDEVELALLQAWWTEAARVDGAVVPPDAETLATTPRSVQRALRALSGSRFFSGLAERALLSDLRQVRRYFREPETRQAAQAIVGGALTRDVRVVIGHSLGSVIAYETLCALTDYSVEMLTLGSPLGIRNLIFDRLQPLPQPDRLDGLRGAWPAGVQRWVNIADAGDVVALEPGPQVAVMLCGYRRAIKASVGREHPTPHPAQPPGRRQRVTGAFSEDGTVPADRLRHRLPGFPPGAAPAVRGRQGRIGVPAGGGELPVPLLENRAGQPARIRHGLSSHEAPNRDAH